MTQLREEAVSDVKFPQFKHGHTWGVGRTDFAAGQQLYWPSDDEIGQELDAGIQKCKAHFSEPFGNGDTLLGLLRKKDIDKYTLFDPKSQAFERHPVIHNCISPLTLTMIGASNLWNEVLMVLDKV